MRYDTCIKSPRFPAWDVFSIASIQEEGKETVLRHTVAFEDPSPHIIKLHEILAQFHALYLHYLYFDQILRTVLF